MFEVGKKIEFEVYGRKDVEEIVSVFDSKYYMVIVTVDSGDTYPCAYRYTKNKNELYYLGVGDNPSIRWRVK